MAIASPEICMIGANATILSLSLLAARSGSRVHLVPPSLFAGQPDTALHRDLKAHSGGKVPRTLTVASSLKDACEKTPLFLVAVPGDGLRKVLRSLGDFLTGDQILVHTQRSIEYDGDGIKRASEIIISESCVRKIGCLAGPIAPKEILAGQPAAMAIASPFHEAVEATRKIFEKSHLHLFSTDDLPGVELGNAMNGIYAMAGGMASALGFGSVTQSFVITRGLAEMARFGVVCGARADTFSGLSGLGSLFQALKSEQSRNFRLGVKLAEQKGTKKGMTRDDDFGDVAGTLAAATAFARKMGIPMPILFTVHQVVTGKRKARDATKVLIRGAAGREVELTLDPSRLNLPIQGIAPKGGRGKG